MKHKFLATTGLVLATLLAVSGCSVSSNNNGQTNGEPTNLFEDDGCTHITVATSSEKVNLMDALAEKFKESPEAEKLDKCVTVKPINVTSGDGTRNLSASTNSWPLEDEEYWPTLWSPASTVWTDRVAATGNAGVVAGAASFTHTPVVFAVPESMTKALNYPAEPISLTDIENLISAPDGWGSVGKPLWGSFKISKTNPNTSTTGLSTILMQAYEAAGKTADLTTDDIAAAEDFSRAFELGAIHYGDTTGKVLTTLYNDSMAGNSGSSYVSAIAVEETSLINYNLGNPASDTVQPGQALTPPNEKLVAVYPENGSMWSDNPIAVLNAGWVNSEKKAAGQAFAEFLQTKPAQEVLPEYGFRPLDETVPLGKLFTAEYGINPDQPTVSLPKPDASVVSAAIDQWTIVRKPSAVLELIDLSGSMEEGVATGGSKLDGAIEGVISTVDHFRSTDEIGVWAFTSDISSEYGQNVAPVQEFGPLGNSKETLAKSVEDLRNARKGATPLYDSISTAYDYMTERAEPGRINAIVVLTDGADSGSSISLDSLLIKLNADNGEVKNQSPVRIFPIAYGADANFEILQNIAKASGGQAFDARDPSKIDRVFAQVINNF